MVDYCGKGVLKFTDAEGVEHTLPVDSLTFTEKRPDTGRKLREADVLIVGAERMRDMLMRDFAEIELRASAAERLSLEELVASIRRSGGRDLRAGGQYVMPIVIGALRDEVPDRNGKVSRNTYKPRGKRW